VLDTYCDSHNRIINHSLGFFLFVVAISFVTTTAATTWRVLRHSLLLVRLLDDRQDLFLCGFFRRRLRKVLPNCTLDMKDLSKPM
jgi:hypothetical protein